MDFAIGIIGGGPAGMSAAIYAARAGRSAAIFEGAACGGQMLLAHEIENYPGVSKAAGYALADQMMEQIEEAYGAFVDAFVNEFLPEADAWLYDWFYNNPDKVIAFFNEYGDEIVDLIEENQDAIKNILGYIALEYGEDMVVFVLNNPETVFSDMVAWYDEYS